MIRIFRIDTGMNGTGINETNLITAINAVVTDAMKGYITRDFELRDITDKYRELVNVDKPQPKFVPTPEEEFLNEPVGTAGTSNGTPTATNNPINPLANHPDIESVVVTPRVTEGTPNVRSSEPRSSSITGAEGTSEDKVADKVAEKPAERVVHVDGSTMSKIKDKIEKDGKKK